jgi:hypothetical protein
MTQIGMEDDLNLCGQNGKQPKFEEKWKTTSFLRYVEANINNFIFLNGGRPQI